MYILGCLFRYKKDRGMGAILIYGNFNLRDPPYLIIAGNCQENMKLN